MSACVAKYHDQLISIRRHLHTMPEEGWSEFTTTNFIVEKLKEYGYEVLLGTKVIKPEDCLGRSQKVVDAGMAYARQNGVSEEFLAATEGYTGCCGILDTGRPGPTLAMRFDIDCVPVTESTEACHIPSAEGFISTDHITHYPIVECEGFSKTKSSFAPTLRKGESFRGRAVSRLAFSPLQ